MKAPQNYTFLLIYSLLSTEVQNTDILHHSLATGKLNQKREYLSMLSFSFWKSHFWHGQAPEQFIDVSAQCP